MRKWRWNSKRDRAYLKLAKKKAWAKVTWKEWYYDHYLLSDEWKAKRKLVLKRDKYTCQRCKKEKAIIVHHITYKNVKMMAANENLYELVSLCEACHKKEHSKP